MGVVGATVLHWPGRVISASRRGMRRSKSAPSAQRLADWEAWVGVSQQTGRTETQRRETDGRIVSPESRRAQIARVVLTEVTVAELSRELSVGSTYTRTLPGGANPSSRERRDAGPAISL